MANRYTEEQIAKAVQTLKDQNGDASFLQDQELRKIALERYEAQKPKEEDAKVDSAAKTSKETPQGEVGHVPTADQAPPGEGGDNPAAGDGSGAPKAGEK